MEGRENAPGHSRGHHFGHGLYPFSSHWPSYSPGNVSNSSSGASSSPTSAQNSSAKTTATTLVTSSSAQSALGPSWWHPHSYPTSEMLHFSSPPWSSHDHHESHSASRDSGPLYHGSHSRNGPYHSSGHHGHSHIHGHSVSHGHSYHPGRGSHAHGGTLIHFPHSSGHQSQNSRDEKSSTPSLVAEESSSPGIKEKHSRSALNDAGPQSDFIEREHKWEDISKSYIDKALLDEAKHLQRSDSFSPQNRIENNSKHTRGDVDNEMAIESEGKDSKPGRMGMPLDAREQDKWHEKHHHMSNFDERGRADVISKHDQRHNHDPMLPRSTKPSYISSVSEKALASAKASYLSKDNTDRGYGARAHEEKHHGSFPFSPMREKEVPRQRPGIMGPLASMGDREMDYKRDLHHREHVHNRGSPVHRESSNSSPQNERMIRAEATREWVSKQPSMFEPSSYVKPDQRGSFTDGAILNRKRDSPKSMSSKSGSGKQEKFAKKEQHYESPLNSSLPRYSVPGRAGRSELDTATPEAPLPKNHHGKNPFNVDFLSVSSDMEAKSKREVDRHYHVPLSQDNTSDRVSVIKSSLPMPQLHRDARDSPFMDRPRHGHGIEFSEQAYLPKPTSLLDSPIPPKVVPPVTGKPRSFTRPDDISSKNSESSSSSEEDSADQIEDEADPKEAHIARSDDLDGDGTENDEVESQEVSEAESGSGSEGGDSSAGSGSESGDDDNQSQSTQDASDNFSVTDSTPEKRKGAAATGSEPKRRKIVDDNMLRVPLAEGWRRQTRIKAGGNGESLRGDVYYFAPCGKKIRTYPELLKYLEKNEIEHLNLDHFSFSTKTVVGEFMESKQGAKFEILSEEEVLRRHALEKERQIAKSERLAKRREKKKLKNEMAKRAQEARQRRHVEKQVAFEAKLSRKRHQRVTAEEKRVKKENERQQRELERLQRQEQLRVEREMRARSIQQEREMKRQQTVILKQQEKERRKQHLMMIRALESQRKAEERERKKEEKRLEKRLLKQRKMEQRRLERSIARELKKPVDDMVLNDGKPLPEFSRIKGLNIPGRAYADLLMVEEFVYCFGHVLDIDPETDFPCLADLQSALLNESGSDDALITACESLLTAALQDPGVVAKTKLGVSLEDIELNDANMSEVLRLFIIARNDDVDHELSDLLKEKPIHSLSPVQKAAVLAFLVNELLCSNKIYNEMDNCLEHMSNLRRDKWNMEGRIRKLKADLKTKKIERGPVAADVQANESNSTTKPKASQSKKKVAVDDEASNLSQITKDEQDDDEEDEEDEDDEEKDSDDEEGDEEDAAEDDNEEEDSEDTDDGTDPTTAEEIEKRITKLEKKHSKYRHKLFTASHTLRGLCIGQDRYKRRYHILPHAGGVYVEGIESGELQENDENPSANDKSKDEKEKGRRRTSSGNSISDSNSTPTSETKQKLTLDIKTNDNASGQIGADVVKSPNQKNLLQSPALVSPIHFGSKLNNVFDKEFSPYAKVKTEEPKIVSPNHSIVSPNSRVFSPKDGLMSPPHSIKSPVEKKEPSGKWFSLFPMKACDETSLTRSSIILPAVNKGKPIVPPNVDLLSQDRNFCDSLASRHFFGHSPMHGYMPELHGHHHHHNHHPHHHHHHHHHVNHGFHSNMGDQPHHTANGSGYPVFHYPGKQTDIEGHEWKGQQDEMSKASMLGLAPPGVDIQKLIQQDPQKAAVLLEMQMLEPAAVPDDKRYGWWRIADPDVIHRLLKILHTRGIREKMLHKSLTRHTEYACSSCKKNKEAFLIHHKDEDENKEPEVLKSPKKEKHKGLKTAPQGKIEDRTFPLVAFSVDKDILIEIEELEEKMFSASLQNKTWRLSQKASSNLTYVKKESKMKPEEKPLELAKSRLLSLEKGIERRYLKPPFRLEKHPNQAHIAKSNGDNSQDGHPLSSDKDWRITPSLLLWRETVESCTSAAQLAMCISMLKDCIAWERSIMKVFCIECRKGDNEDLLLLCDQCDRGCHTYCCNPKLAKIPDGDWFCRECIMMASGSDQCYGCQGSTGKRLKCQFCPRYYHLFCLDPPLQKTPRSPWACPVCKKARLQSKRTTKRKKKPEDEFESFSSFDLYDQPTKQGRAKKNKMNNRKQAMELMQPCRQMLAEMERHECSWPFLVPVNAKQFPEYYRIIKNPMDFHTMKVKLRDFQYKSQDEFANDARLVFRNCDIFNEDDSEVGQAGKNMLKFFEKRWIEVLANECESKGRRSSKGNVSDGNGTAEETSGDTESEEDDNEEEEDENEDGDDDNEDGDDDDEEDEEEGEGE
ncbi:bromodomain adjacent to zinc finger domain protein 2B-like isoform X2 [Rhopilema esculentum]|uniref:bromodomain adjacent to zinc finger domain protein 2B-like isoform X2 n=1 Tax=Rhopilema esculentum TaxID=499914 RepID=UPI0031D7E8EF